MIWLRRREASQTSTAAQSLHGEAARTGSFRGNGFAEAAQRSKPQRFAPQRSEPKKLPQSSAPPIQSTLEGTEVYSGRALSYALWAKRGG